MTYTFKLARRIARLRAPLPRHVAGPDGLRRRQVPRTRPHWLHRQFRRRVVLRRHPLRRFRPAGREVRLPVQRRPAHHLSQPAPRRARGDQGPRRPGGDPPLLWRPVHQGRLRQLQPDQVEVGGRPVPGRELQFLHRRRHHHRPLPDRRAAGRGQLERSPDLPGDGGGDGALQQGAVAQHGDHRPHLAGVSRRLQRDLPPSRRGVGPVRGEPVAGRPEVPRRERRQGTGQEPGADRRAQPPRRQPEQGRDEPGPGCVLRRRRC